MAFGNISTLYLPTAANAGASQWGTDVRKLLSAADAGSDSTTQTDHSTGGSVVRTVDPYTTSTTDGTEANFGWAVTPSDMNSVSGARRFYPAGNHTATIRMRSEAATGVASTLTMYVYRVSDAAGGRARTLLGSAGATVTFPALSGEVTGTVTVALGEVIFAADETVQYGFELTCAGVVVTGRINTFFLGTQSSVASRVDTPRLGVLADTTGSAAGAGSASGEGGKVLGTIGSATGLASVSGSMGSTAGTTGTAAGTSTVDGQGSSVAGTTGSASGTSTVAGQTSKVLGTTGTVNIGGGAPTDFTPNDGLKAISGNVLHHETGAPIVGATVRLIRDSDGFLCTSGASAAGGAYSFPRGSTDPNTYHVTADYLDAGTQVHGVSDRGLVPV